MSELKKGIIERLKKKQKPATIPGLMQKLLVYEQGKPIGEAALLGSGWVEIYPNGTMGRPDLWDFAGVRLPQGWYNLVPTDEVKTVTLPWNRKVRH